jgi:hypothetical protein
VRRLDGEASGGQPRSPVGPLMRQVVGALPIQHGVTPGLKPRSPATDVVGQEPREAGHLDHGEQAAGAERVARLAQRAVRIGHVM